MLQIVASGVFITWSKHDRKVGLENSIEDVLIHGHVNIVVVAIVADLREQIAGMAPPQTTILRSVVSFQNVIHDVRTILTTEARGIQLEQTMKFVFAGISEPVFRVIGQPASGIWKRCVRLACWNLPIRLSTPVAACRQGMQPAGP